MFPKEGIQKKLKMKLRSREGDLVKEKNDQGTLTFSLHWGVER